MVERALEPQRSPLSPLLSNIMLDDLDWELEKPGHHFVRYADDGRIYARSERAGQRVLDSITRYIEQRLKLRVNRRTSTVASAVERPLLGFQFFRYRDGRIGMTVAPKALKRAQDRIRQLPTRNWGVSMDAAGEGDQPQQFLDRLAAGGCYPDHRTTEQLHPRSGAPPSTRRAAGWGRSRSRAGGFWPTLARP